MPLEIDRSEKDAEWMAEALKRAEIAALEDEVPVGAIVVHRDPTSGNEEIVGEGYNRRETDENPVAHAEILAIQDAAKKNGHWRLIDCLLYVTLEPCPMCLAACSQARISALYFGAKDPKGGALSLGYNVHEDTRLNHRFRAHFLETAPCGEILTRFFSQKRKPPPADT